VGASLVIARGSPKNSPDNKPSEEYKNHHEDVAQREVPHKFAILYEIQQNPGNYGCGYSAPNGLSERSLVQHDYCASKR
jgi:hypothetical protein